MLKTILTVGLLLIASGLAFSQSETTNDNNDFTIGQFHKYIRIWNKNSALTLRNDGDNCYLSNKADFVGNKAESGGKLVLNGSSGVFLNYGDEGTSGKIGLILDKNGNTNMTGNAKLTKYLVVKMGNKALTLRNDGNDCFLSNKADFVGNKAESGGKLVLNGSEAVALNYGDEGSSGTSGLFLNSQGKIGIGTTKPKSKLDVNGTTRTKLLTIVGGADIVESFESVENNCEPGDVVVIDELNPGQIRLSTDQYDKKVAGVVSGANGLEPGIELGSDVLGGSVKIAMTGRVWVKCTDENGTIKPGDRLTTSSIKGYAMKASDNDLCGGAVIGKAMTGINEDNSMVLVLVNLQ